MNKVTVHLINDHPQDIHTDGAAPVSINAFVLLTNSPCDPPAGHVLCFGNSDVTGRLLFSFWKNCVLHDPDGAMVIETVARDIIRAADAHRKEWPGAVSGRVN